jgi:hypothetical protein
MAVFGQLYDQNHDVIDVIAAFIRDIVLSFGKSRFSEIRVQDALRQKFDFELPSAVVGTALRKLSNSGEIVCSDKGYSVVEINHHEIVDNLRESVKAKHATLMDDLKEYINGINSYSLNEMNLVQIEKDLIAFFTEDKTSLTYGTEINAYLVSIGGDKDKISNFNLIKEGIVLYSGLVYEPDCFDTFGEWSNCLTIFFDTEILFFLAGYHGVIYQNAVREFIDIVHNINGIAKQNAGIELAYFRDVGDEIDNYFRVAEGIVAGTILDDRFSTAMNAIIANCKYPSAVIHKKATFYDMLEKEGITEYNLDDYNDDAYEQYGIQKSRVCSAISSKNMDLDLEFLSYINFLRRGNSNKGFYNAGYFLITGTNSILSLAKDDGVKKSTDTSLAFNLPYVTTRLWIKMHKSLSLSKFPKALDVVTNAQIALSNQLQGSVSRRFEELKHQVEQNSLNEETGAKVVALLRSRVLNPDDITENNLSDTLNAISEKSIDEALRNQEQREIELRDEKEKNERLARDKETLASQNTAKDDKISSLQNIAAQQENELNRYKDKEKAQVELVTKKKRILKLVVLISILIAVIVIAIILAIKFPSFNVAISICGVVLDLTIIIINAREYISEYIQNKRTN